MNKLANKSTDTGMAVSSLGTKHNVLHLFFKKAIDYLDTSNLQYNQVYSIETNADAGRVYIAGVGGMIGVLVDKFGGVYDQVGGDVSISVSGSYSSYVGNLSDENLWGGDYNTNILKYFNEHPNSGLELYNGPAGNLILIKRTGLGVQQYDGYGFFF